MHETIRGCRLPVLDKCQRQNRPTPTVARTSARNTELTPRHRAQYVERRSRSLASGSVYRIGRDTHGHRARSPASSQWRLEAGERQRVISSIMDHLTMASERSGSRSSSGSALHRDHDTAELYELLVIRRGWSTEQYGRFIGHALTAALLPSRAPETPLRHKRGTTPSPAPPLRSAKSGSSNSWLAPSQCPHLTSGSGALLSTGLRVVGRPGYGPTCE
jgi:hypothetical protein